MVKLDQEFFPNVFPGDTNRQKNDSPIYYKHYKQLWPTGQHGYLAIWSKV